MSCSTSGAVDYPSTIQPVGTDEAWNDLLFFFSCLSVVLLLLSIDAVRCLGVPSRGCLRRRWLRRGRLRLVALGVGGPQGQVVPQQLHDERAVLVRVLVQGVQLGDSVVESLVYVQKGAINIVPEFL